MSDDGCHFRAGIYGVVFYFDEAIDYMRCQSVADGHSSLARLSSESLSYVLVVIESCWCGFV